LPASVSQQNYDPRRPLRGILLRQVSRQSAV
jgi:hypothetical protein